MALKLPVHVLLEHVHTCSTVSHVDKSIELMADAPVWPPTSHTCLNFLKDVFKIRSCFWGRHPKKPWFIFNVIAARFYVSVLKAPCGMFDHKLSYGAHAQGHACKRQETWQCSNKGQGRRRLLASKPRQSFMRKEIHYTHFLFCKLRS